MADFNAFEVAVNADDPVRFDLAITEGDFLRQVVAVDPRNGLLSLMHAFAALRLARRAPPQRSTSGSSGPRSTLTRQPQTAATVDARLG
jgi:hypothetical protein